jgi:hypothetical protein
MPPLLESLTLGKIYSTLEALEWSDSMHGPVSGRGGRWAGQTGSEILPTHIYRDKEYVMSHPV